jgi:hypothetical protein
MRDSDKMVKVVRVDATEKKKKNERRETPLQATGSIDDGISETSEGE